MEGKALRKRDEWNTNKRLTTFRIYMTEENKIRFLNKLDEKGRRIWEKLIKKIEEIMYNNILKYSDIFDKEEKIEQEEFAIFCMEEKDQIPFNMCEVWSYLNYFYIENLDDEFKNLKWKDIIDCGWYNGDSSLAMIEYLQNIWKIYCIEPELENFWKITKIIKQKNINNITPINLWLWDKKSEWIITEWWAWSNLSMNDESIKWEKISIDTIDNIVRDYNISPWLIKRDIEWFEYSSIVWAKETIVKHKPILLISIYHTWKDWFEILPLIESRNLDYKFTLRRWNCFHPFADTLLICY